jgi:MFS family permease
VLQLWRRDLIGWFDAPAYAFGFGVFSRTSGSNWRHLNRPQTEEARRSIRPAYHGVTAKLQHFLLNPYVIMTSVFAIGVGFALNAPAWTSSVSEVVSNVALPSAGTLGGLQLNISGIIGPALGGLLVPVIGPNFVFAVNAACFRSRCTSTGSSHTKVLLNPTRL